jgi:hypothetical protein
MGKAERAHPTGLTMGSTFLNRYCFKIAISFLSVTSKVMERLKDDISFLCYTGFYFSSLLGAGLSHSYLLSLNDRL